MTTGNEEKPRSYTEVVKHSTDEDEIKFQPKQSIPKGESSKRRDIRRTAPPFVPRFRPFFYGSCFTCGKFAPPFVPRFRPFFHGSCFTCGKIGHKAVNYFQRRNFETRNNSTNL